MGAQEHSKVTKGTPMCSIYLDDAMAAIFCTRTPTTHQLTDGSQLPL